MTGFSNTQMDDVGLFKEDKDIMDQITQHKNPLVIYHHNCADGFAAAWCFWNIQDTWETTFDFHPGIYNDPPPDVEGRIVYLVDFSYKRDVMVEIVKKAQYVYLIDHHKTALEDLDGRWPANFIKYCGLDNSGAVLTWDFLHNTHMEDGYSYPKLNTVYEAPPQLILHIQDRDLWQFKLPYTREIQANLFSYPYDFAVWDKLMAMDKDMLYAFALQGEAIERKHHKDIRELVNVCRRLANIGGYTVPIASLPYTMSSDAGHLMAKEYEEGRLFAACYIDTADHRVFSLRSCPDGVDVSGVAKQYGGGGHRNAAGFRVPRGHELAFI